MVPVSSLQYVFEYVDPTDVRYSASGLTGLRYGLDANVIVKS